MGVRESASTRWSRASCWRLYFDCDHGLHLLRVRPCANMRTTTTTTTTTTPRHHHSTIVPQSVSDLVCLGSEDERTYTQMICARLWFQHFRCESIVLGVKANDFECNLLPGTKHPGPSLEQGT